MPGNWILDKGTLWLAESLGKQIQSLEYSSAMWLRNIYWVQCLLFFIATNANKYIKYLFSLLNIKMSRGFFGLLVVLGFIAAVQCQTGCVGDVSVSQRSGAGSSWTVGATNYYIFGKYYIYYFIYLLTCYRCYGNKLGHMQNPISHFPLFLPRQPFRLNLEPWCHWHWRWRRCHPLPHRARKCIFLFYCYSVSQCFEYSVTVR